MHRFLISLSLLLFFNRTVAVSMDPVEKTITVKITAAQDAFIDGIKVNFGELGTEIHKRLWRSFMGNDKMPESIAVIYEGEVNDETKAETGKAVKEAQQRTLTMYALFKYKKKYEDLTDSKKSKIREKLPVLFQQEFN